MTTTSPLIRKALDQIKELRDLHRALVEQEYLDALEATNGRMLNQRGEGRGIRTFDLFTHNRAFFSAYASEELAEWRAAHPHLSFAEFERQMTDDQPF